MKRQDIPKHLRHLTDEKLKALFYLFRGKYEQSLQRARNGRYTKLCIRARPQRLT